MNRYVVYEVWTRHRIVEALSDESALEEMPEHVPGMNLANWYAVDLGATAGAVDPVKAEADRSTSG